MSAVQYLNDKAEVVKKLHALAMNINAAGSLQEVMKSNLGPKGTLKMLVGGAGQIKLTKDGNVLLKEMQIQHPTAAMIARAATAQDDIVGDGTTSNVLFTGEMMRQAERLIKEGVHPRVVAEGYELARVELLKYLDTMKIKMEQNDKNVLLNIARTSLSTKLQPDMVNLLVDIIVDSVLCIIKPDEPIDLHMIEIMYMSHKLANDTKLVKGLVLDHGARHPDMPRALNKCYILTLNVSLEYEKTEVNSQFFYSNAQEREKLMMSEHKFIDNKCQKIIELKRKVCTVDNGCSLVVINQKGVDPLALDALAKEGIIALRRAKRRNMERLVLACGGNAVHSVDDMDLKDLGYAEKVYESVLGEDKYTFVEGCKNPLSCTILIKGQNDHVIAQIKDSIRDGIRAVKNVLDDQYYLPGAGAFEISGHNHLLQFKDTVQGKAKLGVQAFADSLLIVPKVLAENSGYDIQEAIIMLLDYNKNQKVHVGLDLDEMKVMVPEMNSIIDNYCVKKQFLHIAPTLAQQLLLVDEIMRAGINMKRE